VFAYISRRDSPNLTCSWLETRKRFQKGQNYEKVSWVRVPVRMVSVARKLSAIKERRQDQNRLFRRGYYRNTGHNQEKLSWVRVPVRMVYVARILSAIEERRQDQNCLFRRGDYRNTGHNPEKLSWVRVPVKIVEFPLCNTEDTLLVLL
jgi:hypothetical protein